MKKNKIKKMLLILTKIKKIKPKNKNNAVNLCVYQ